MEGNSDTREGFKCYICGKILSTKYSLKRHTANLHASDSKSSVRVLKSENLQEVCVAKKKGKQ